MAERGQNLRVFIGNKCIAAATSCQFHIGLQLEESTTKDSEGMFQEQTVVGKNWDVSCDALFDPDTTDAEAMTSAELLDKIIMEDNPEVTLTWQTTKGEKNRVAAGWGYSGKALYNDFSTTNAARQRNSATHQFTGNGKLTKVANS